VEAGIKIGLVNTAEVLLARLQGAPVKVVAGYFGETTAKIFVRADAPMKTAKDLDGMKVGILSETHTSYRAVLYMNHKLGIKAEPVALGNLANNMAALRAGTVDAFYSAEGAALTLVDSGVLKILVALADIYPRPYTAVVVWATDDLIDQKPDLVKRFVKTVLEAVTYLKEHPDHASDLYIKKTGASRDVAGRAVTELNKTLMPDGRGSGQDLVAAVAGNWEFTKDSGAISPGTNVNIKDAVDLRFLP
jgi:NitT/TauT family transport system substrate-binding protein